MVLKAPESIKHFSDLFLPGLENDKGRQLADYMTGLILGHGKRTLTSLGEVLLANPRHKTVVSKFIRRSTFRSGEILYQAAGKVINAISEKKDFEKPWVLIIDGSCTRRGAYTKISNAIQYNEKRSEAKGRSTKAPTFIMGLLISPV